MKCITEREIINARMRANGYKNVKDKTLLEIPEEGFKLTEAQTIKGLNYLLNLALNKKGLAFVKAALDEIDSDKLFDDDKMIRKNNPFGYREMFMLLNFNEFRLVDFYDDSTNQMVQMGYHNYLPVYEVIAKDGSSFSYVPKPFNDLKIEIVG